MNIINPRYLSPVMETDLSDPFWNSLITVINGQAMREVSSMPISMIERPVRNAVHNILKLSIKDEMYNVLDQRQVSDSRPS